MRIILKSGLSCIASFAFINLQFVSLECIYWYFVNIPDAAVYSQTHFPLLEIPLYLIDPYIFLRW